MQPSSLIFLVIIGIWAAYFVQYWVRRREHLATIRSVDAFSETMRVLQLRAPLSTVDTGSQAPRTYAVSPARAMRPQVTVKRADASTMLRDEPAATPSASSPSMQSSSVPARQRPLPARDVEPEVATMRPSRATRGIVLVVGLLGTLAFGLLAAFGVLVAWAPLVPLAMAGAGFGWLRAGVQAEARARRESQRPTRRATAAPRTSTVDAPVRTAARAVTLEERAEPEPTAAPVASAPFDVSAHTSEPEAEPFAEQTVVEQPVLEQPAAEHEHEVALPDVDEDDIPLTWDPRPVPRPTYTMKAKAPDRPFAAPQPERGAEHTAYDELPQRRISGL